MTVVPVAFQVASWIPPWWRGLVGGDELLGLISPDALASLAPLRAATVAVTAYCPALGVGCLPGPKPTTEAAVAAVQAVIVHAAPGSPAHLLIPVDGQWQLFEADPARPVDLDLTQADVDLAQAVVAAEHELRELGSRFSVAPARATARPLPPDADSRRRGLLVRAVRLWTAVDAVPQEQNLPLLDDVARAAARATLAAYCAAPVVAARESEHADRRLA